MGFILPSPHGFSFFQFFTNQKSQILTNHQSAHNLHASGHLVRVSDIHVIDSDQTIRATSINSGTIGRPADGDWPWWLLLLVFGLDFDLSEQSLAVGGNIEDFDTGISGNSQPLVGCVETE